MERMLKMFMERIEGMGMAGQPPAPVVESVAMSVPPKSSDGTIVVVDNCDAMPGDPAAQETREGDSDEDEDDVGAESGASTRFADGFGELESDANGDLRYVGIASTASVVDTCIALRQHISDGLERKGYTRNETFLSSPEATADQSPDPGLLFLLQTMRRKLPSSSTVKLLVKTYVDELFFLFPIVQETDLDVIVDRVLHFPETDRDSAQAAVLLAVMAVAEPLLPASAKGQLSRRDAGQISFYTLAMYFINDASIRPQARPGSALDIVIALGLLAASAASAGSEAEAWLTIGRAIRHAQDIGLHRSPARLRLPPAERTKRRYVWWCLYVLERQLCTALGRPLAIEDADCDVEIPSPATDEMTVPEATAGFLALVPLYRVIGRILRIVSALKTIDKWPRGELQARVREANTALQCWAREQVPSHIKTATVTAAVGSRGVTDKNLKRAVAEKHVALSCFFSAVLVLHRVFMWNPHRPSPLGNPTTASARSVKAATDCIRGAADFAKAVPARCHYVVFHGQYVFISAIVLLHSVRAGAGAAMRLAHTHGHGYGEDVDLALRDVASALDWLKELSRDVWPGAAKCVGMIEEYLEFTLHILQHGWRGSCYFEDGAGHRHQWKSREGSSSHRHHPPNKSPVLRKRRRKHNDVHDDDAQPTRRWAQQQHHHPKTHSAPFSTASSTTSSTFVRSTDANPGSITGMPRTQPLKDPALGMLESTGFGHGLSQVTTNHKMSYFDDVVENLLGMAPPNHHGADPVLFSGLDDFNFELDGFSGIF